MLRSFACFVALIVFSSAEVSARASNPNERNAMNYSAFLVRAALTEVVDLNDWAPQQCGIRPKLLVMGTNEQIRGNRALDCLMSRTPSSPAFTAAPIFNWHYTVKCGEQCSRVKQSAEMHILDSEWLSTRCRGMVDAGLKPQNLDCERYGSFAVEVLAKLRLSVRSSGEGVLRFEFERVREGNGGKQ